MGQLPSEVMAVLIAEGIAVLWLILKIDKRLAVMEAKLKYIERRLGMGNSGADDL